MKPKLNILIVISTTLLEISFLCLNCFLCLNSSHLKNHLIQNIGSLATDDGGCHDGETQGDIACPNYI